MHEIKKAFFPAMLVIMFGLMIQPVWADEIILSPAAAPAIAAQPISETLLFEMPIVVTAAKKE